MGVGANPCCDARIDLANGITKDFIAMVDISENPRPPKPVGVVAMHHACSGKDVEVESGSPRIWDMYVLVMESIVLVKLVWWCLYE